MTNIPNHRDTFVLRIWREEEDGREQSAWRGWVQHVSSGDQRYLQSTQELIRFIEGYAGELAEVHQSPERLK